MNNKNNVVIFQSNVQNVKKEWIDYNGHMNVAYYTLAFDNSLDEFLETILATYNLSNSSVIIPDPT